MGDSAPSNRTSGWGREGDLTEAQRVAAARAQKLISEVVDTLPRRDRASATRVPRAIASSPRLQAAYREAVARGDRPLAIALPAVATGVIRRQVNGDTLMLSESVVAVPLMAEAKNEGAEWSQAVLATMIRLGILRRSAESC